jgi:hypothetical protein
MSTLGIREADSTTSWAWANVAQSALGGRGTGTSDFMRIPGPGQTISIIIIIIITNPKSSLIGVLRLAFEFPWSPSPSFRKVSQLSTTTDQIPYSVEFAGR